MLRIFGLFYKEIQKCRCRRKFRTRQILLSFDDGPDPLYTDRLLELLKREEVPAVFFVVAEKAARYPQIIEHILADGHRIEYHGADHRHFAPLSRKKAEDFLDTGLALLRAQGLSPSYFRPPFGMLTPAYRAAVRARGLKLCFWSCMAQDWRANSTVSVMYDKLCRRSMDGALVCLHDSGEGCGGAPGAPLRMIAALERYIACRKRCGYEFISFETAEERGLLS